MSLRWYRVALTDGEAVTMASARGEHLGVAIAAAAARVGRGGKRVWPVAAAAVPEGEVPLGESIGRGVVVGGDAPPGLPSFEAPPGVVPMLGERMRGSVRPGLVRSWRDDTHVVEAVVAGADAREAFFHVVEHLPAVDNVEVELAAHLEDGAAAEVWLTPRLRDVRRAVRFLDDFEHDVLTSGHVDVAVYLRAPMSTWRFTQHKTLVWLSADEALTDRVVGWLRDVAGIAPIDPLATVADAPHLHYRGPQSSPRKRLLARLRSGGLRRVDNAPAPAAPR